MLKGIAHSLRCTAKNRGNLPWLQFLTVTKHDARSFKGGQAHCSGPQLALVTLCFTDHVIIVRVRLIISDADTRKVPFLSTMMAKP